MTTPLTDEQLAEIEKLYQFDVETRVMPKTWELSIDRLIQEVRRLRDEITKLTGLGSYDEAGAWLGGMMLVDGGRVEELEKAEAEVERLRGLEELGQANMNIVLAREKRLEAERDRYKAALREITTYSEPPDGTEPTQSQVALAALNQKDS